MTEEQYCKLVAENEARRLGLSRLQRQSEDLKQKIIEVEREITAARMELLKR